MILLISLILNIVINIQLIDYFIELQVDDEANIVVDHLGNYDYFLSVFV